MSDIKNPDSISDENKMRTYVSQFTRCKFVLILSLILQQKTAEAAWTLTGSSSVGVVGEQFTLTCTPDRSNNIVTIQWRRDNVVLAGIKQVNCESGVADTKYSYTCSSGPVFHLTIPVSSMTPDQHNTVWRCQEPLSGDTAVYTLSVNTPVSVVTIQANNTAYPGVSVVYENEAKTFTCTTNGYYPQTSVTLTVSGARSQINSATTHPVNGLYVTRGTFTVTATREDQGQIVTCTATNNIVGKPPVSQTITLDVYYSPTITLDTTTIMVEEGTSFNRACSATGHPTPVVNWYRDIVALTSGTGPSASLSYGDIDRSIADTYTCRATSNAQYKILQSEASVSVIVQYPPTAEVQLSEVTENDTNVEIICDITNGVPTTNTFHGWSQSIGGTVIRSGLNGTSSGNSNKLVFPPVRFEDIGDYKCEVSNGIKGRQPNVIQSDSAYLSVRVPAKFNSNDRRKAAEQNKDTTLSFPFYSNPSTLVNNIKWTNKSSGTVLTSSNSVSYDLTNAKVEKQIRGKTVSLDGQVVNITFNPFLSHYVGNYTIDVTNGGGLTSSFTLEIGASAPPDKPIKFGVLGRAANSITLTWAAGFNGGHPQKFVVRYSKSGIIIEETIEEKPSQTNYTYTVDGLNPSTKYQIWLYAKNVKGNSSLFSDTPLEAMTAEPASTAAASGDSGAVVGGVVGALLVIAVIAIVIGVIFYRRRQSPGKSKSDKNGKRPLAKKEESDHEDELRPNILYESADSDPKFAAKSKLHGGGGGGLYSEARNQQTGPLDPSVHYAVVQKDTKPDTTGPLDHAVIYSEPDKPKKDKKVTAGAKPKEKSHKEKGGAKAKTKAQPGKEPEPVLYEEVGGTGKTNLAITNEKPSHTGDKGKKKKQKQAETKKNQDGLTYVDLDLTTPQKKGKKGVVHGMENRTEYSEVDFNRHANPLPPDENDNV